jgi:hypothetical protein
MSFLKGKHCNKNMHALLLTAANVLQLIRKFCKANGLAALDPPMSMAPGVPKRCPEEELVKVYAGTSGDGRLARADYLTRSLMANKRMILWDVLLNCRDIPGVVSSPDSALQSVDI